VATQKPWVANEAPQRSTSTKHPTPATYPNPFASTQRISGSAAVSGGWCSHGGAEARREQREESTTGHKGNWRVPCSCLCVKHPWLPSGVLHCPGHRPSILCGCINFPGKQVNAVWGRYPTACVVYFFFFNGVHWGLVDKISPAFELRNSGVPPSS
jgi:hypothetical protein